MQSREVLAAKTAREKKKTKCQSHRRELQFSRSENNGSPSKKKKNTGHGEITNTLGSNPRCQPAHSNGQKAGTAQWRKSNWRLRTNDTNQLAKGKSTEHMCCSLMKDKPLKEVPNIYAFHIGENHMCTKVGRARISGSCKEARSGPGTSSKTQASGDQRNNQRAKD